jgi:protein bicaudal C
LFDITDENEQVCSAYIGELMQSLDIYICMKPKAKQFTHSIIIKSIEQNMDCVYEARQKIMEVSNNVPHRSNLLPPDVNPQTTLPSTLGQVTEETNEEVTTTSSEDLLISSLTPPIITETNEVASLPPTNNQFLQSSLNKSQGRLTVKSFVDYEKRKEKAEVARKAKVNPNNTRYPSNEFTGDYFSWSMPPVPKEATKPVLTINSTPNGLDSISRKNFAVLMQKANMEREQTVTREKNIYHDIKDLSSLLLMLGLEKYEANFAEEEVSS